ncbi:hypothetical protein GCM10009840_01580 [Pseudolysinimonas kribbensis]
MLRFPHPKAHPMPASRFARLLAGPALLALAAPVAVALLLAGPAAPARASLGSVPVVVSDYVADGSLQARLQQLYGPGTKGAGVDFDSTTKTGDITRVWEWTADRYAHPASTHPIQLTNYWIVAITISAKPVGVAAVWINPKTDGPDLAQFTASSALADALAKVPANAALVHDSAAAAWFAVAGKTADPLVAGRSGVTAPTQVADLKLAKPGAPPAPGGDPNTGIGLAVGLLVVLVIVIVVALVLPDRLRRAARPQAVPEAGVVPQAEDLPAMTPEPAEPEPVEAQAAPKPPAKKAAGAGRTPVSQKPAASKPGGTKPAATKPAVSKPPASKPPASKPPVRKPRPPKAPDDGHPAA